MQFYLVFPLLARVFRRFPLVCWAVLSVLAQVYIVLFAHLPQGNAESLRINQFSRRFWVYMQTVCCVRSSSAACGYGASANGRKTVFYRLRR